MNYCAAQQVNLSTSHITLLKIQSPTQTSKPHACTTRSSYEAHMKEWEHQNIEEEN